MLADDEEEEKQGFRVILTRSSFEKLRRSHDSIFVPYFLFVPPLPLPPVASVEWSSSLWKDSDSELPPDSGCWALCRPAT